MLIRFHSGCCGCLSAKAGVASLSGLLWPKEAHAFDGLGTVRPDSHQLSCRRGPAPRPFGRSCRRPDCPGNSNERLWTERPKHALRKANCLLWWRFRRLQHSPKSLGLRVRAPSHLFPSLHVRNDGSPSKLPIITPL